MFDYHKELHYSQTYYAPIDDPGCLTTIKNYTTLKPQTSNLGLSDSLHTTKTG